jgi:hypothetical protein
VIGEMRGQDETPPTAPDSVSTGGEDEHGIPTCPDSRGGPQICCKSRRSHAEAREEEATSSIHAATVLLIALEG